MTQNHNAAIVKVNAGSVNRQNDLVRLTFKPKLHLADWREGASTLAVSRCDAEGRSSGEAEPAQFEPTTRELTWRTGDLPAGASAHYVVRLADSTPPTPRYRIEQKPAHLLISADDQLFARYNFLGVWKPYFWPLNGNHGTVAVERPDTAKHA